MVAAATRPKPPPCCIPQSARHRGRAPSAALLPQRYPHVKECKYCKVCVPDRLLSRRRARQLLQQLERASSFNGSAGFEPDGRQGLHLDLSGLDQLDRGDLQLVQQLLPRWAAGSVTAESLEQLAATSRRLAQHLGGKLEYDIAPLEFSPLAALSPPHFDTQHIVCCSCA